MKRLWIRITCALTAIVLTFCAAAAMFTTSAAQAMTVKASSVTAEPGTTVQMQLMLSGNPGLASLKASVRYDPYLTLTDVSFNSAFGSYVTAPTPYTNPQTISAISPLTEIGVNGVFATLTFKVSDDAPNGYEAAVSLTYDPDDVFDTDYENIPTEMIAGFVKIAGRVAGDADADGALTLKDVILICRWIVGGWKVTINESLADVNGDSKVDMKDVILLRRHLCGGWDVKLK